MRQKVRKTLSPTKFGDAGFRVNYLQKRFFGNRNSIEYLPLQELNRHKVLLKTAIYKNGVDRKENRIQNQVGSSLTLPPESFRSYISSTFRSRASTTTFQKRYYRRG